ncbi:hypothetical protein Slin_2287 [Spirosoma linguale DSM 74]|uniref:Uncharacterized protein n=1 Tax=Spirosoma linguale (strain ATCC 33905 / DSM 74 / LMG 10896 / Claus 1) TaxID=504472 RepID=D2QEQ6_SPILD|nr:hypothetical protein Slin_2287 [Spirosoma linguale DSM 74]
MNVRSSIFERHAFREDLRTSGPQSLSGTLFGRTSSHVLQKAKTVLQKGGSVVVLVDKTLGGAYSPNIFRLAEKINADIIFFNAALQQDGIIKVSFHESEWNGPKQVNCVERQLNELYHHTATLLQQYNNSGYFTAPC